jgi:hypothetical protein
MTDEALNQFRSYMEEQARQIRAIMNAGSGQQVPPGDGAICAQIVTVDCGDPT